MLLNNPKLIEQTPNDIMHVNCQLVAEKANSKYSYDYQSVGTAVLLSPSIAITAKHVIDEHQEKYKGQDFSLSIIRTYPSSRVFNVKTVVKLDGDLALLNLVPDGRYKSAPSIEYKLSISFELPHPGEEISFFGYHMPIPIEVKNDVVEITRTPISVFKNKVIEVFPRGAHGYNYAHFTVEAPTTGGMSGGGAFNANGYLCGIISRGWDGLDGPADFSRISLLFPLATIGFQLENKLTSLYKLSVSGDINAVGIKQFITKKVILSDGSESDMAYAFSTIVR